MNNNNDNDNNSLKILIIAILLAILIYLVYVIFSDKQKEKFGSVNFNILNESKLHNKINSNLSENENLKTKLENLKQELSNKNNEINKINNYTKYNKSVNNSIIHNAQVPSISFKGKNVINTKAELNKYIGEVDQFKSQYQIGDIVTKSSDFNITAEDICNNHKLNNDDEINNCMVCSTQKNINKDNNTNIKSVCLYSDDGIMNYEKCQDLCSVNN